MIFSMCRSIWARIFPPARLKCRRRLWTEVLRQLRERGGCEKESGCFLLGVRTGESRSIKAFVAYDTVDPKSLQGSIVFDGSRMDKVWTICREMGLQVVADVHTHPFGFAQSSVDRANPMIPECGHLAIIVPNFADRDYLPDSIGIYEFRGRGVWLDHSAEGSRFFAVGRLP